MGVGGALRAAKDLKGGGGKTGGVAACNAPPTGEKAEQSRHIVPLPRGKRGGGRMFAFAILIFNPVDYPWFPKGGDYYEVYE